MKKSPVLQVVLDGFGLNPSRAFNGWAQARTPHMVGHTAVQMAIFRAVGTVDLQSARVIDTPLRRGWRVLLTADHRNCDEMIDPQTGEPHTRHTAYPVLCLVADQNGIHLGTGPSLLLNLFPAKRVTV